MHCSLKVKNKKNKKIIILLSLLSLNKHFLFSFSLSPTSLLSTFFLNFFFLQLIGQLPHPSACRPSPLSPICSTNPTFQPTPSPITESTWFPSTQMGYRCFLSWQAIKASWFCWVGGTQRVTTRSPMFVYDFTTCCWRRGNNILSKHLFFAIGAFSGQIYIAGGHDENKNMLESLWVYNLRKDEWAKLTQISQEWDECEGVVIGWWFFLSCCGLLLVVVVVVDDCAMLCWCFLFFFFRWMF